MWSAGSWATQVPPAPLWIHNLAMFPQTLLMTMSIVPETRMLLMNAHIRIPRTATSRKEPESSAKSKSPLSLPVSCYKYLNWISNSKYNGNYLTLPEMESLYKASKLQGLKSKLCYIEASIQLTPLKIWN